VKPSSLLFLIQEALLNIRRNGLMSLAALGTVSVALTVFGASTWTAHRINEYAGYQPQKFDQVDAFIKSGTSRDDVTDVQSRIRALGNIRQVTLVTREDAWARLQSSEPELTESVEGNPLPDKLEVEVTAAGGVAHLAKSLRDKKQFPEITQVNDAGEEVRTMLGFARMIRVIGGAAAIGLLAATLLIVQNTIRLTVFARRREIRIMQLVGATPRFIRLPLLLEGMFYGVVGAIVATGIVLLCGHEVSQFVTTLKSPLLTDVPTALGPKQVATGLIIVGGATGLIGSYLSARRFLRQI
jgi:cell division transport system permease protein